MKFAYLIEPPFNYRDDAGRVTGCDVELARIVLSMIGVETVEFVETEFSNLLPGLEQGRWDVTTGLFDTAERRKIAAFSRPIWALSDGFLVLKGNPCKLDGYVSAAQNPHCRLAVVRDQVQHHAALASGMSQAKIVLYDTYHEAARAVVEKKADAYASVAMAHRGYLAQNPSVDLEVIAVSGAEKSASFGAFGFRHSDKELKNAIDGALAQYLGSSEHRAMMQTYGFTHDDTDILAQS